jgi:Ca2+:H+ antiporter
MQSCRSAAARALYGPRFSKSCHADFIQILLLVYILYLLFQLKSHAYMYESTPQHVIDEESHPGVLADMLGSSSSSGTSSDTSSDESDATSGSNTTAKRIRRAFRGRRRRKSSVSSKETPSLPSAARTPSIDTFRQQYAARTELSDRHRLGAIVSGDESDADDEGKTRARPVQPSMTTYRDFESEQPLSGSKSPEGKPKKSHKRRFRRKHGKKHDKHADNIEKTHSASTDEKPATANAPRVAFTEDTVIQTENVDPTTKRPFTIRGLSRPTISKVLTQTVFSAANQTGATVPPAQPAVIPAPYGLRRASSLPDRLNRTTSASAARAQQQQQMPLRTVSTTSLGSDDGEKKHISRTAAVILLMISTALVAICAESLVGSINYLVDNTNVGQVFIGLIILPIVGNAAEHVTAVTMASKNKMDLAIGVAVGSSIQIALFVTPLIVLLGWILNKDMSLFFSLFETVALFVSAFIVNFLVLDGRSNYLEGALLIAAYVIIAVAAFFYPAVDGQSKLGGA